MGNQCWQKQPLVSVIVPARNSEITIGRCLNSIRKQDYQRVEIIVVDNHSSDNTRGVANEYGARVYLKGPERGAQVNFGVKQALGKYVYRVDSDFVLQPSVIREAVEICEKKGYDAIAIHNTSDPSVSFWAKVRKVERDCYREDELNVAARFMKKEAFDSVGGFDESLVAGEDYDIHNKLLRHSAKIGRIKSQEIHIGEPRTLAEIVRKHYFYGKSIGHFISKNSDKALKQLSPIRVSYVREAYAFLREPELIIGFTIYQFVRYTATAIGFMLSRT